MGVPSFNILGPRNRDPCVDLGSSKKKREMGVFGTWVDVGGRSGEVLFGISYWVYFVFSGARIR